MFGRIEENFFCPDGQQEMFKKIRETNPDLFAEIVSAVEKKYAKYGRTVVVTIYKNHKDCCPRRCRVEEFDALKFFELHVNVVPTYHSNYDYITDNISVVGT